MEQIFGHTERLLRTSVPLCSVRLVRCKPKPKSDVLHIRDSVFYVTVSSVNMLIAVIGLRAVTTVLENYCTALSIFHLFCWVVKTNCLRIV